MTLSRVLVVEPDASIRALIVALLRRDGIPADGASDSDSALHSSTAMRYAAVVVDPRMPGGETLLNQLYASAPDGKPNVIVVTSPESPAAQYTTRAGVRAVLPKPFRLEELRQIVERCCDKQE